jgi:hypothetical protein
LDFLNLEDVVDCPYDTEEAADDDDDNLERETPRRAAASSTTACLEVGEAFMNAIHL